jgi:hypothetical protein
MNWLQWLFEKYIDLIEYLVPRSWLPFTPCAMVFILFWIIVWIFMTYKEKQYRTCITLSIIALVLFLMPLVLFLIGVAHIAIYGK